MTSRLLSTFALLLTSLGPQAPTPAPASTPADSPIGHWIADHPRGDALELWWDFRPDATLTTTAGVITRGHYKLQGNTLTVTPTSTGVGGAFNIHFRDGKLYSTATADRSPTLEYTRIGDPTSSASALVGVWRITHAPHATDPEEEAIRNSMANLLTVYRADGTYEARLPIQVFDGRWNPAAHTYTLKDHPPLHFTRTPAGLSIALPPIGKDTHLYRPDNLPNP